MIYLDANATTAVSDKVRSVLLRAMTEYWGNPSSLHEAGARSRYALAKARDDITSLVPSAYSEGIIFTSGGTEANNSIIRGIPDATVITTEVEHPSVLRPANATGRAARAPVDRNGTVKIGRLLELLPTKGSVIVSVQWANGETGVVQPIEQIVAAVRERRPDAFIHIDAAQAIGRVPVRMDSIDAITFSGHKLHAPGGTGVLILADPQDRRLSPLLLGGRQEAGLRSGTENVAGNVALGAAVAERASQFDEAVAALMQLRDAFERAIIASIPNARVNGSENLRLPNTSNILFPGQEAMAMVARLDQMGVACSVGSACSSGSPEPSHVLTAMGLSAIEAYSSVRFSFSVMNTTEEIYEAVDRIAHVVRSQA